MTYSLNIWTNPSNDADVRLYINGTSRQQVWFKADKDGKMIWSSKANATPHKFQTGNHYQKVRKDGDAAHEVAEAYGWTLGETDFAVAMQVAKDGIQVEQD